MITIHAIRDIKPEPLTLCRKVRYGKNGNLHRYVPCFLPEGIREVDVIAYTDHGKQLYKLGSEKPNA